MYKLVVFVLLVRCMLSFAAEEKLNIGVKKRVKDCKVKSQNGDTLHMHYTVLNNSINLCEAVQQTSFF